MFVSTGSVGPVEPNRIKEGCVVPNAARTSSLLFVSVTIRGVYTFIFLNTKSRREYQDKRPATKKLIEDVDLGGGICYHPG
jgi:hypothetical protein